MHATQRATSGLHAFRVWLKKVSDDFFYLALQYIQKVFPAKKYPEYVDKKHSSKEHQPKSSDVEKDLHVTERHDTPMRDNVTRFKKGKRMRHW